MRYVVRPISDRTWMRPNASRQRSRFDSTWTQTLQLLGREVDLLGGHDVVFEVDVPERGIRNDGMLRADARAASPAVVVAFETPRHGSMLYRCDRYADTWSDRPGWQENVRAIALTLEALRAVDRYGATETGQQYTGFKALPAGTALPPSHMTRDQALTTIAEILGCTADMVDADVPGFLRSAKAVTHPDRRAGDRTLWTQVEQAARVLGVA